MSDVPTGPARWNVDTGRWEEFEDDSWLDDYEEGSTNEEVMERVKKGMLLFHPDTPAGDHRQGDRRALRIWTCRITKHRTMISPTTRCLGWRTLS